MLSHSSLPFSSASCIHNLPLRHMLMLACCDCYDRCGGCDGCDTCDACLLCCRQHATGPRQARRPEPRWC